MSQVEEVVKNQEQKFRNGLKDAKTLTLQTDSDVTV